MFSDTKNFCDNCSKCLENKSRNLKTKCTRIPKSNLAVGELIAIDCVGPLPRSYCNKNYILTIVEHYTGYLEAIPLQNTKAPAIIKAMNEYFARFGLCKILLSDNGPSFRSQEFKEYLKNLQIEPRKSSIYYPQGNGLIEIIHKSLKQSVAAMCEKSFEWPDRLLFFKLHYNNSVHAVTNFTPAELFFGRNLNIPLNNFEQPKCIENHSRYLNKLNEHMSHAKLTVQENEREYFKMVEKHLKGREKPIFQLGDKVFLKNFHASTALGTKNSGPYEIMRIIKNDNYIIEKDEKQIKVHVSKLIPVHNLRPNLQD